MLKRVLEVCVALKGCHKRNFCSNGRIECLGCGGGYARLHM